MTKEEHAEKWAAQGFCIAEFDIDSDSYVLFICTCETLEKLKNWAMRFFVQLI